MEKLKIQICMGSSCFSRGNKSNLDIILNYLRTNNLEDRVLVSGRLCAGDCSKGPNIDFGDVRYHGVDPVNLPNLLESYLNGSGEKS